MKTKKITVEMVLKSAIDWRAILKKPANEITDADYKTEILNTKEVTEYQAKRLLSLRTNGAFWRVKA